MTHPRPTLSELDYVRAAESIKVQPAALRAVARVEAPYGGFLPDGQVTILFERHWFHKLTNGRWSKGHGGVSNPKPGGYIGKEAEHDRLAYAVKLDRDAALMSASWGKFQIMGFNYAACGCKTLQEFINKVHESEAAQLELFINFLKTKKLDSALRATNFTLFAKGYNGPSYYKHNYDGRMRNAFTQYGGRYV